MNRKPAVRTEGWPVVKHRIHTWLRAGGHNQRWLAAELGITASYVAMILNGRRTPSLQVAKRLEDLTGIPATAFVRSRAA